MSKTEDPAQPSGSGQGREPGGDLAQFSALLEDSAEDMYENAPCGYLSTMLDGRIAKINTTLLDWLGYRREDLVGQVHFSDLLTVGGRLCHETHFAPLLSMQGQVDGIALELKALDGTRLPVLVTSRVKTGNDGQPLLIRATVFDARDRRAYENELLRARRAAEQEREQLRELTRVLQRTLLPPVPANVPGLDVAAYYRQSKGRRPVTSGFPASFYSPSPGHKGALGEGRAAARQPQSMTGNCGPAPAI